MEFAEVLKNLGIMGWIAVLCALGIILVIFHWIYLLLVNKDVKIKNISLTERTQKELYQSEGKNVLDNQCSNAHNLLKKIWIDLYEAGKVKFAIQDQYELFILEDIAHLIEGKLNYEVKNDLTRNHITEKTDIELQRYSDAKALGYYRAVKANLYQYNIQLPSYDLPQIMSSISIEEYKKIFSEIYFNARKIAGGSGNGNN